MPLEGSLWLIVTGWTCIALRPAYATEKSPLTEQLFQAFLALQLFRPVLGLQFRIVDVAEHYILTFAIEAGRPCHVRGKAALRDAFPDKRFKVNVER